MADEGITLEDLDMGVIGNERNLFGTKDYGTPELQYLTLSEFYDRKQIEDSQILVESKQGHVGRLSNN